MNAQAHLPDTLEELRALEREVEREWWWLHGALNAVAQGRTRGRGHCELPGDAGAGAQSGPAPRGDRGADCAAAGELLRTEQWHQQALRLQSKAAAVPSTPYHF